MYVFEPGIEILWKQKTELYTMSTKLTYDKQLEMYFYRYYFEFIGKSLKVNNF